MLRQDPTITAQMIADRLSYSEPKALRYQLNRIGFRNFSEFRNAVLSGEYLPAPQATAAEEPQPTTETVRSPLPLGLPVALRITTAGEPLFADPDRTDPALSPARRGLPAFSPEPLPVAPPLPTAGGDPPAPRWGPRAFGFVWRGESYDAYLRPGALLIIDPAAGSVSGELFLAVTPSSGLSLWRRYRTQDDWLWVHPSHPTLTVLPADLPHVRTVGPVVAILAHP